MCFFDKKRDNNEFFFDYSVISVSADFEQNRDFFNS